MTASDKLLRKTHSSRQCIVTKEKSVATCDENDCIVCYIAFHSAQCSSAERLTVSLSHHKNSVKSRKAFRETGLFSFSILQNKSFKLRAKWQLSGEKRQQRCWARPYKPPDQLIARQWPMKGSGLHKKTWRKHPEQGLLSEPQLGSKYFNNNNNNCCSQQWTFTQDYLQAYSLCNASSVPQLSDWALLFIMPPKQDYIVAQF